MHPRYLTTLVAVLFAAGCKKTPTAPDPQVTFSIAVSGTPPATAEAGTPVGAAFVVQKSTGGGAPSPAGGQSVTISVTAGGGSLGGATTATVTTGADGVAAVEWQLGLALGTQTIRAALGSGSAANLAVEATQPPATALTLATAPGTNVGTGNPLNPQPAIQLKDRRGTNVPQAGVVVTVTIETGGGTLSGSTTATTSGQGTATFTDLTITGAAGPRVLRFTAAPNGPSLSVSSAVIQVAPPPELALATPPSANLANNVAFFVQPAIQLKTGAGANVAVAGVVITAAIATGPGTLIVGSAAAPERSGPWAQSSSMAEITATTDATGKAQFSDLTILGPGSHTLRFTAAGYTAVTSGTLQVAPSQAVPVVANGVETDRLTGVAGSLTYFTTLVPPDAAELAFLLYGGTGQVHIYARRGRYPTSTDFDCGSFLPLLSQRCDVLANRSGVWYVALLAVDGYQNHLFRALSFGPGCEVQALVLDVAASGTLTRATDCTTPFRFESAPVYDRYRFVSAAPQVVQFRTSSSSLIGLGLKEAGLSRWRASASGLATSSPFLLPQGNIQVDVFDRTGAGATYSITVIAASPDLAGCGAVVGAWGFSASLQLAPSDCPGLSAGTRSDLIRVVVQTNQTLTATMTSTAFDPLLRIYRGQPSVPTGVPVGSDDNGAGGTGALLRFVNLDLSGTVDFTIEATSAAAGGVGSYTLTLTLGPEHYSAPPANPSSR